MAIALSLPRVLSAQTSSFLQVDPPPPATTDFAAVRGQFAAAVASRSVDDATRAARDLVRLGSVEAVDVLIELGLLSGLPGIELVVREELGRTKPGPGFDRLCEQCNKHALSAVRDQLCAALAMSKVPAAYRAVLQNLYDKEHGVVLAAIDALKARNETSSVSYLIDALEFQEESNRASGVVAHRLRDLLTKLAGLNFYTAREWKRFWAEHGQGFKKPTKAEREQLEAEERAKRGGTEVVRPNPPKFFGIEVLSQRVVFLLDVSMSMAEKDAVPAGESDGKNGGKPGELPESRTRLKRLQQELDRMIASLPSDTQFTVISFSSGVTRWNGSLQPATDANKASARTFIGRFKAEGETWTDDALKAAFAVRDAHTIFLLSDGAPVRNEVVMDVPAVLDWLRDENRFRRLQINTIGFAGTQKSIGDFLREIARNHRGIYQEL
ncbi:MAG: VWA domain-containing protein [Planctomycetota bacterium]